MTVIDVKKDSDALTLSIVSRWNAPPARLWLVWADPRQLERWWGPPTYPATVVDHDLRPGGSVNYFMTGPEGDKHHGWWKIRSVDEPHRLEFDDGFADDIGTPNPDLPITIVRVTLVAVGDTATEMTITSQYPSVEAMEQLITMGMLEGMIAAMGQIRLVLAP